MAASETRSEEALEWLRRGIEVGAQMGPPGSRQIARKSSAAADVRAAYLGRLDNPANRAAIGLKSRTEGVSLVLLPRRMEA